MITEFIYTDYGQQSTLLLFLVLNTIATFISQRDSDYKLLTCR